MTFEIALRPLLRICLVLFIFLLVPFSMFPQVTLTGAVELSTDSTGSATNQRWNTLGGGGDGIWDLWVASDPNAALPVNGPSDAQAGIDIPLEVGRAYTYYIFSEPNGGYSFDGLNLFFDGNNSTPGISVFGAINSSNFRPNSGSTWTLAGASVAGSGTSFYTSGGVIVVLNGYNWNTPADPPGDVCQSLEFAPAPGNVLSYFGSFNLQVWPAAALSLSQTGGPPGTKLTTTGSGFAPTETVGIYANHIGGPPLMTTTADASGAFTISTHEPQIPYGPIDSFAVGQTSGKLGAASFFVTAAMVATPHTGVPGDTVTANGLGFGAGEAVDVYWDEPRQLLGTTTANGQGTSTLKITIPANAPRGLNGVRGVGQTTKATGVGEIVVK